ncbi:7SK snRNA methylphosphate capping enzyme bin3 [Anopheles maculipalpis]|uniref:7SK snRNA methylphosphate capping enzyme bin3 n=1 Tax=Anopheles maculipalpis TaxID=1496333 RepID=UPI002159ADE3|nr:7SK snRNA methylphosphate capping enzyme bin3 [Anopheles maculipalpis]
MAGPVDTRKRSREEEQNEFMPLSKRINNLHLNNNQHSIVGAGGGGVLPEQIAADHHHHHHLLGATAASCAISAIHHSNHHHHHLLGVMGGSSSSSSNSSNSNGSSNGSFRIPANSGSNSPASTISINGELLGDYCPVLSAEENPHYFTKNKILYELYVERMSRLQ